MGEPSVPSIANAIVPDDRRSRRTEIRLAATIDVGAGRVFKAVVHNISAHGVMAEVDAPLAPGRPVSVTMAGLCSAPGRVAWMREGHVGVAFTDPLTLDQINAIL